MKRLAYILLILLVPALAYAYVVGTPSNMVPGNWQAFAVDPGAPDSGVTSTAHVTLKNLVTAIGTTKKSTIVFPHTGSGTTTQYTIGTALDLSSYSNITFQIENGAQLKVSAGVSGVTLPSPANVSAQPNQQIMSGTSLFFSSPGTVYPEWFGEIDGTNDEVQINYAINSLPNGGEVKVISSLTVNAEISGTSNVSLGGINPSVSKISIGTAYINALYSTGKGKFEIKNIEWSGSKSKVNTERLIYLSGCTDFAITNCSFKESVIGVHVETCTRGDISENTFNNMLRKTDFSEGYGILATLASDSISANRNKFNGVERHCIYFSSGTKNSEMIGNIARNVQGMAYTMNTTDAQSTSSNIIISKNIVDTCTDAAGGTDDRYAIGLTGNIIGVQVSGNIIRNNQCTQGGGIYVQNSSTATNVIRQITIDGNIIENVEYTGIQVNNGQDIIITNNHVKDVHTNYMCIAVSVSGSGVGSGVTNVLIENNCTDTAKRGISVAGVDLTHKAVEIVIGDNTIKNMTTANYNNWTDAYVEYKTKWKTIDYLFYMADLNAGESGVSIYTMSGTSTPYTVPVTGWVTSIYGRVNGTITASGVTLQVAKNGAILSSIEVVLDPSNLYNKTTVNPTAVLIEEGDTLLMVYSSSAGFLPSGSLYLNAGIEVSREISK